MTRFPRPVLIGLILVVPGLILLDAILGSFGFNGGVGLWT
jgi:hypothetical protein